MKSVAGEGELLQRYMKQLHQLLVNTLTLVSLLFGNNK